MTPSAAADGVKDNKLAQNPEVGDNSPILCRPRNTPGQAPTGLSLTSPLAYPVRRGGRGYNRAAPSELHFL